VTDGPLWRVCYGAPPTQPAIAPTWRLAIMRDIALTTIIFGLLPFVLVRPSLGILLWTWIGLMNPHKLTFGFAYNFPFAEVIGIVTIISIVLSNERKSLPLRAPVVLLLALNLRLELRLEIPTCLALVQTLRPRFFQMCIHILSAFRPKPVFHTQFRQSCFFAKTARMRRSAFFRHTYTPVCFICSFPCFSCFFRHL
jgi:hypothetical protein